MLLLSLGGLKPRWGFWSRGSGGRMYSKRGMATVGGAFGVVVGVVECEAFRIAVVMMWLSACGHNRRRGGLLGGKPSSLGVERN
jgi:hypothetical protein